MEFMGLSVQNVGNWKTVIYGILRGPGTLQNKQTVNPETYPNEQSI